LGRAGESQSGKVERFNRTLQTEWARPASVLRTAATSHGESVMNCCNRW
jgi:hypothetical protein